MICIPEKKNVQNELPTKLIVLLSLSPFFILLKCAVAMKKRGVVGVAAAAVMYYSERGYFSLFLC